MKKAYALMCSSDRVVRSLSKFLRLEILQDPNVCWLLNPEDLPVLADELVEGTPSDDLYLIRTYIASSATRLVTSDVPLHDALTGRTDISVQLRDDFLKEYLPEG
jgi:hypothetical protein